MAALPSLYQDNTASAAMIPPRRSGETAGDSFATPKRTQFVAVPPPPRGPSADSSGGCGSDGAVHVMHRPEVAVGRRRGAGPRARRYSDGGSALSGVGVSPRSQPPQSALVSTSTHLRTMHTRRLIMLSLAWRSPGLNTPAIVATATGTSASTTKEGQRQFVRRLCSEWPTSWWLREISSVHRRPCLAPRSRNHRCCQRQQQCGGSKFGENAS
eukprot:COSAG02_NODE_1181_length_14030_cov_6.652143_6_plen_213_part_00